MTRIPPQLLRAITCFLSLWTLFSCVTRPNAVVRKHHRATKLQSFDNPVIEADAKFASDAEVTPLDIALDASESHPDVQRWIENFRTRDARTFDRWMKLGGERKPMIEDVLLQHGVPRELYFLALIESDLSTSARSYNSAVGPWQFIPATARTLGLKVNKKHDERRDLEKSTVAAAKYLKQLFNEFGDWYLAIAAYNAGTLKIQRAIAQTGSRNFWTLSDKGAVSRETKALVARLVAVIHLSRS